METFRYADGLARGIGRGALQGPSFERPFWGIRATGPVDGPVALAHALALRLPERAFFFGQTAALLHGIPLPSGLAAPLPLHVGVPAGTRRVDPDHVVAHHVRISDDEIITVNGLRMTNPGRTWCDLAASGRLGLARLAAAGDRILWWRAPLGVLAEIQHSVAEYDGRRGVRLMRAAIPLLSGRSDSAPESEIRIAIWSRGLPQPLINHPVRDSRGNTVATPDFTWPAYRVALEYEGDHHRVDAGQWHHDVERFGRMQEIGWVALRATARDYRDPGPLLRRLEVILATRRPR